MMISVATAKLLIKEHVNPLPVKLFPLPMAAGLVLASDVYAKHNIPAFEQSSMDGYAIRFEDKEQVLTVYGEMQAGTSVKLQILPQQAVRIFTGAALPDGADTVVMQEKVKLEGKYLRILDEQLQPGSNVRNTGAEVKLNALAMAKGTLLTPAALAFLAGIGEAEVLVCPTPSTGIILTGKELALPGTELTFGQVYEANSYSLTAALNLAQVHDVKVYRADDNLEELTNVLQTALSENQLVLLTGGVSVGDYDFVLRAAENLEIRQVFHKVKQKPGKPLYFGKKGEKTIFGLPGNPSSVLSCFYNYVLPAIELMAGKPSGTTSLQARLTDNYIKSPGLTHFLKGYYKDGAVTPLSAQESFRLSSFAQANCLICLDEERGDYLAGETVTSYILPG